MALFNKNYPNQAALETALGTKDYVAFQTDRLYDGKQRLYVFVPSLDAVYARLNNGSFTLVKVQDEHLVDYD